MRVHEDDDDWGDDSWYDCESNWDDNHYEDAQWEQEDWQSDAWLDAWSDAWQDDQQWNEENNRDPFTDDALAAESKKGWQWLDCYLKTAAPIEDLPRGKIYLEVCQRARASGQRPAVFCVRSCVLL